MTIIIIKQLINYKFTFKSSLTPSNSSTNEFPNENDEKFEKFAANGEKFEFPKSSAARLFIHIVIFIKKKKNTKKIFIYKSKKKKKVCY